ncbi:MAG TPA: hypothetical protein VNP72_09815 [Longimicrobium sp.]|nr:hypothetical protein [Longimicrobium sp.]
MKRLKLNVEELTVESFEATGPSPERGTVNGHAKATYACTVGWDTCDTQAESCGYTCWAATGCNNDSQCVGWCMTEHGSCSCFDCTGAGCSGD